MPSCACARRWSCWKRLTAWSDEMLKLDTETLTKVLKLGARIKKLLGKSGRAGRQRRHDRGRPARALSRCMYFCSDRNRERRPWPPTIR